MHRLLHSLRWGFPVPGGQIPWGADMARFGAAGTRTLTLDGTASFAGLDLYAPTLVGGSRDVIRVVMYELRTPPDLVDLEAQLGTAEVQTYANQGLASQVSAVWTWVCGQDVTFAVSIYAALRGAAHAGVFLSCEDARLAEPWVADLTADAPWRAPGSVEPLGVPGVEPCRLTDAELALRRPGLVRPAAWAPEGLWASAGAWGIADGRVTSVFREGERIALVHERTLPARGPGGASLRAEGVVLLVTSDPHGLDGLVAKLEARGATVILEVHYAD